MYWGVEANPIESDKTLDAIRDGELLWKREDAVDGGTIWLNLI